MIRPSKRKLILYAAVAVPCLIVAGAWLARAPLGVAVATDYLRRHGAEARIRIDRLGPSGFAGSASIGPRDDPDVTVERIEADYALFPDWRFAPVIRAVRLSGVEAKAGYDGKTFQFGSLQRLIDEALAEPGGGPAPSVQFERTRLRLATPAGPVVVTGQGRLDDGRIERLALALSAPSLAQNGVIVEGVRGTLTAAAPKARLDAQLTLAADALTSEGQTAKALTLRAALAAPYGRESERMLDGPASLTATLQAGEAGAAGWSAESTAARLELTGALSGGMAVASYQGRAALAVEAARAGSGGAELVRPAVNLASDEARLTWGEQGVLAAGELLARVQAPSGVVDAGGRPMRLSRIAARGQGPVAAGPDGVTASLEGALDADGAFSAADAAAMAAQMAPPGAMSELNAALTRALRSWRLEVPAYRASFDAGPATLHLPRPARVRLSGGQIALAAAGSAPVAVVSQAGTAGALRLSAGGEGLPAVVLNVTRYGLTAAGLSGAARLEVRGDVLPVQGLELAANLTLAPGAAQTVRLQGCSPLTFAALRTEGDPLLTGFSGEICPASSPALSLSSGRWRASARMTGAAFALPAAQSAISGAAADLTFMGAGGAKPSGEIMLTAARLTDGAAPLRYSAMDLTGRFTLANDVIAGTVSPTLTGQPAPLGALTVRHSLPSGEGAAVLAPTRLNFTADGMQPDDIAPAAAMISKVEGSVEVSANFAWGPGTMTGSALAATETLDLSLPGGRLQGLSGKVVFPTLLPAAATAPDQHLTARRFENAAAPMTDIDLRFALDGEALRIGGASARLAQGTVTLDPMVLPLTPGATTTGLLKASGVDLGEIINGLNLSESLQMQAKVAANLPFSLTPEGLRIAGGRVAAEGPGRLSLNRTALTSVTASPATGEATAPGAPPATVPTNAVQDFAYQALENLAFEALEATVDSRPMGRLGVVFRLKGRHDPPVGKPARIGLIELARGTAFDEPIPLPKGTPVDLTLDTSLNFDDLMAAYGRLGRSDSVQP